MKKAYKTYVRLDLVMLITTFAASALISFVLTPLYSVFASDVIYGYTIIPELIRAAIDLLDIALMSVAFSIITVALFMKKRPTRFMLIYVASVLFRRLSLILVTFVTNGQVSIDDVLMSVSDLIFELILLAVIFAFSAYVFRKYCKSTLLKAKASALFGDGEGSDDVSALYPFKKIYSRSNPLQTCLLRNGIILSAVRIISRIIWDISYGAPSDAGEVLLMAAYYLSDVVIVVISYALSCLLISCLYRLYQKRSAKELGEIR